MGHGATVLTIGHSTRSFDEVLSMLRVNDITDLVDVRAFPSSRTFPQWNRDAIVDALPDDLEYHWVRELGGRRHTPAGQPTENGAWRVKAFRDYADHMATPEFARGLAELTRLAGSGRPAIMCSEAVPWRCHRRLIADALIVDGVEVEHIMSMTSTRPARLSDQAVVAAGRITYPPTNDEWDGQGFDVTTRVCEVVAAIPAGRVATYGDIGHQVGAGPRQIGRIVGHLDEELPWWRVVRADGTPASCRGGGATERLRAEGTPMNGSRVRLPDARHEWESPPER
jgi:alkylated DNA nucleotide flippase Atl1